MTPHPNRAGTRRPHDTYGDRPAGPAELRARAWAAVVDRDGGPVTARQLAEDARITRGAAAAFLAEWVAAGLVDRGQPPAGRLRRLRRPAHRPAAGRRARRRRPRLVGPAAAAERQAAGVPRPHRRPLHPAPTRWCRDGHRGWEPRATTDPARIRRAWSTRPYGVGVACGPSGLLVVDLDRPKPDQEPPAAWAIDGVTDGSDVLAVLAERAGQPFPADTYTVHTGRGGTHLYFARPAGVRLGNSAGERGGLGWLVDTRGIGGYVVAAGSTVDGRPYTVGADREPAPLPELARRPAHPAGPRAGRPAGEHARGRSAPGLPRRRRWPARPPRVAADRRGRPQPRAVRGRGVPRAARSRRCPAGRAGHRRTRAAAATAGLATGRDRRHHPLRTPQGCPPTTPARPGRRMTAAHATPAPVDAAALLDDVRAALTRFVILPSDATTDAVVLWIAATHAQPAWAHAPRLVDPGAGEAVRQVPAAGRDRGDLPRPAHHRQRLRRRGLPGDRHRRPAHAAGGRGRHHLRQPGSRPRPTRTCAGCSTPATSATGPRSATTPQHPAVEHIPTFAMAALAGIGHMPDTIEDRAVIVRMRRRATRRARRPVPAPPRPARPDRAGRRAADLAAGARRPARRRHAAHAGRGPGRRHLGTAGRGRRPGRRPLAGPRPHRGRAADRRARRRRRRRSPPPPPCWPTAGARSVTPRRCRPKSCSTGCGTTPKRPGASTARPGSPPAGSASCSPSTASARPTSASPTAPSARASPASTSPTPGPATARPAGPGRPDGADATRPNRPNLIRPAQRGTGRRPGTGRPVPPTQPVPP